MKKLLTLAAVLCPFLGFSQTWPPSVQMDPAGAMFAQPELNLVLRPVTTNILFNNVVPWDKADMYIVPPGLANAEGGINADGTPSRFYSVTPLSIQTCLGGTCNIYFQTRINWYGQGDVTPVTDPSKYPTGFETTLPAGNYDVIWRMQRNDADSVLYSPPAPGSAKAAAAPLVTAEASFNVLKSVSKTAAQNLGRVLFNSDTKSTLRAQTDVHITAILAGTFVIKTVQDNMAAAPDDGSVVSVSNNKGNNIVAVNRNAGEFNDFNNTKIHVKIPASATAAAVFFTADGQRYKLKDSFAAATTADSGAAVGGAAFTLDSLKNGADIAPVTFTDRGALPVFYNGVISNFAEYDTCLMAYALNEGTYDVTVVYVVGDNVYYKTVTYAIKWQTSDTGITKVNADSGKIVLSGNTLNISIDNIKDVKVVGMGDGAVFTGNSRSINTNSWPTGVYIVQVTTTDNQQAVRKILKK